MRLSDIIVPSAGVCRGTRSPRKSAKSRRFQVVALLLIAAM